MKTEAEILKMQDFITGEIDLLPDSWPCAFDHFNVEDVLIWILDQE